MCKSIRPDLVIAIDSLASTSPTRLGNTIQISSTGIIPGTGLGNRQGAINEETLGVPVIAIGVPTIINSKCFVYGMDSGKAIDDIFVAPKEINEIVNVASKSIGGGVNQAFGINAF